MTMKVMICRSCDENWTRAAVEGECPYCGSKVIVEGTSTPCTLADECVDQTHDFVRDAHIEELA